MNVRFFTAALLLASAAGSQAVQAQSTGIIPVRGKIGAYFPQGTGKNVSDSITPAVEVDVALPELMAGKLFVSAGYTQGSRNGGNLRVIPVTIGRFLSPPNPVSAITGNVYFGAGLGAYFVKANNGITSDSSVKPGGFAVAGYQLPNPYFVEAKYHLVGKTNGVNPSGFSVMVGRRF